MARIGCEARVSTHVTRSNAVRPPDRPSIRQEPEALAVPETSVSETYLVRHRK